MIDVERDLDRYQKDTLRKIRPQQIYQMGWFENKNGLSREVELSVLPEPVLLRIVSKQFENALKYSGYKYIHQGMYIIGIKGMTRKKLGTKVLITLYIPFVLSSDARCPHVYFLDFPGYGLSRLNN